MNRNESLQSFDYTQHLFTTSDDYKALYTERVKKLFSVII